MKTTGKVFGCRPLEEHIHEAEGQCLYPLMLADGGPKKGHYHSLNWVMAGKAKSNGGRSEMGKQPCIRMQSEKSVTST